MNQTLIKIDDKHVPVYQVMWVADLPHFCGSEECEQEGRYEIALAGQSVWASGEERDNALAAIDQWGRRSA